jgi:hypothetical protein
MGKTITIPLKTIHLDNVNKISSFINISTKAIASYTFKSNQDSVYSLIINHNNNVTPEDFIFIGRIIALNDKI